MPHFFETSIWRGMSRTWIRFGRQLSLNRTITQEANQGANNEREGTDAGARTVGGGTVKIAASFCPVHRPLRLAAL